MNDSIKNIKLDLEQLYQNYVNYTNTNNNINAKDIYLENLVKAIDFYKQDTRKGVTSLLITYQNKIKKQKALQEKFKKMTIFEQNAYSRGFSFIAGLDEVGRGPLAGPVVTASVILPKDFYILGIDDSKKLSEEKRNYFYDIIVNNCIEYTINRIEPKIIDEINILKATKKSMLKNIDDFKNKPDCLIIDAVNLKTNLPNFCMPKADENSISVACASIIAKVTRDKIMLDYSEKYPEYGFEKNKGYGVEEHIKALKKYGACSIHRRSFIKNFL